MGLVLGWRATSPAPLSDAGRTISRRSRTQTRYPVPLGRTVSVRSDFDCPFRTVYIASTLHHIEVMSDAQKAGVIQSALSEAVRLAIQQRVGSLGTAVMISGWRLPFDAALTAMLDCLQPIASGDSLLTVSIHILSEADMQRASQIAAEWQVEIGNTP